MLVTRALHNLLAPLVEAGEPWDGPLQLVLYEIPDEAMEQFQGVADPVEVPVLPETEALMTEMAAAFGLTPLGLSYLMSRVGPKAIQIQDKVERRAAGT